jgi:hypothetical protein
MQSQGIGLASAGDAYDYLAFAGLEVHGLFPVRAHTRILVRGQERNQR